MLGVNCKTVLQNQNKFILERWNRNNMVIMSYVYFISLKEELVKGDRCALWLFSRVCL